jgi:hypothetical protein
VFAKKTKSRPNDLLFPINILIFYKSIIGLYLGTNDFITAHPIRYAIAQKQKTIKYPAGLPSNPRKVIFVSPA